MNNLLTLIFFLFLSPFQDDFRPLNDPAALKKKLSETVKNTSTITSSFTQEKGLKILEKPLVSSGSFYFKKPGKIRWEYTTPYNYRILITENSFTINDDGKTSTYDTEENKVFGEISNMISATMQGNILNDSGYEKEYFTGASEYKVVLLPLEPSLQNFIKDINIFFDKETMGVNQVSITEPGGDYTLIKFENRKMNVSIDESIFSE